MMIQPTCASRNPSASRRGVTLIEVILVITVLAAAATIGAVRVSGDFGGQREVDGCTNLLLQSARFARSAAIRNQATVVLSTQRVDGEDALVILENAGPLGPGREMRIPLSSRVRVNPRSAEFRMNGSARNQVEWTISASPSSGASNPETTVRLNPITGRCFIAP
ncbi:MAG: prepilin-type N-terminal cleavage/methylation domain-containing protein [Planctomycetota bacterium]